MLGSFFRPGYNNTDEPFGNLVSSVQARQWALGQL